MKIFANPVKFFKTIEKVFENIDKEKNTERKFEILK